MISELELCSAEAGIFGANDDAVAATAADAIERITVVPKQAIQLNQKNNAEDVVKLHIVSNESKPIHEEGDFQPTIVPHWGINE
jgi:hypothetical protein